MKIKYLGLLSCLLICSCDLIRDENYYNVNKDDKKEYTTKDFSISHHYAFVRVVDSIFGYPAPQFNSSVDEGYFTLNFYIGNIKSNENVKVKAISNFRFYDANGDILLEKEQVVNDFFAKKYTLQKSYEVYDETCKSSKCFEYYYYHVQPECELEIHQELSFFNQSMRGEITFSLLNEDGSYYHTPLRADTNISYTDGITYVEDFSPWYEVK